jgi:broad specificity phosphatase PhoE
MTALLLARHGETDDNAPPQRVQGSRDPELNRRGRDQARALADRVAGEGVRALWSSSLRRAAETAAIVGAAIGLEPRLDPRLAESDRGAWEGRLLKDIEREEPELWAAWRRAGPGFRFPGGESLAEHEARVRASLEAVAAGPLPVLVVCHGGSIRCAFARRHPRGLGAFHELEVPNGALLRLPPDPGR